MILVRLLIYYVIFIVILEILGFILNNRCIENVILLIFELKKMYFLF